MMWCETRLAISILALIIFVPTMTWVSLDPIEAGHYEVREIKEED